MRAKLELILWAEQERRLGHLVVSGAAGGKLDATRIEVTDLSQTCNDPLLSKLRYSLRRSHGFPREGRMRVAAVFSGEPMRVREDCSAAAKLACAGYGSLVSVTAGMGMAAAGWVLNGLARSAPE
jgi:tRNA A37 threonylcarbamoyladenosine dehydratase